MKKILIIIIGIVTTIGIAIQYEISKNSIYFMQPNSFIWFIVLAFLCIVLQQVEKLKEKRLFACSAIISLVLASFAILGYFASNYSNGEIQHYTKHFVLFLLIKWLACFISMFAITVVGYHKVQVHLETSKNEEKQYKFFTNNKKSILAVSIIIAISYLPYFLNYFPGNGMPDSVTEVLQAIGVKPLSNHHPAMHILIVRLCFTIGNWLCHNYIAGYVIYMILQMAFACVTFSYVIYYMAKNKVGITYRIFALLFFMFCPIITLYNTTLLKDVPFALCIVWYTIFCTEMIKNTQKSFFQSKGNIIALTFVILGVMFFRNNGIYVILLTFPVLLWFLRKQYKIILAIFIISIAFYKIITGPVYGFFGIKAGSPREALSIPLQQFARISKYKSEFLKQEEKEKIYQYLPVENIGELYHPLSSDPVKNEFSEEGFKQDKLGLIKLYMKLAIQYPGQTFYSFVNNSYGYYYPDTIGWGITYGINQVEFKNSKSENLGLDRKPIIEIKIIDKIHDFINEKNIPLFSMLASSGFYFWIMCLATMYCVYSRRYKLLISFLPIFVVWLTCLASPVFCENRYIYSLYIGLPLLVCLPMMKKG